MHLQQINVPFLFIGMFQIQTLVSRCQDRSAKVPYIICDEAGQENKSLCCGHKGTCLVIKTCEYLCIIL